MSLLTNDLIEKTRQKMWEYISAVSYDDPQLYRLEISYDEKFGGYRLDLFKSSVPQGHYRVFVENTIPNKACDTPLNLGYEFPNFKPIMHMRFREEILVSRPQKGVELIFEQMMERIVNEYMKTRFDKSIVLLEKPNKTYLTKENAN